MVEDVYASSFISIHTPLAGSDAPAKGRTGGEENFNPHSPCGERLRYLNPMRSSPYFNPHSPCGERQHQSCSGPRIRSISIHTPLAGSDSASSARPRTAPDFNPHSPCGERHTALRIISCRNRFQSTLPLRGATAHHAAIESLPQLFQSTLPLRGATRVLRTCRFRG